MRTVTARMNRWLTLSYSTLGSVRGSDVFSNWLRGVFPPHSTFPAVSRTPIDRLTAMRIWLPFVVALGSGGLRRISAWVNP